MIEIDGTWFDGLSSAGTDARMSVGVDGEVRVYSNSSPQLAQARVEDLNFSAPVGNIPRRIEFAGGTQFVTPDNAAVDQIIEHFERPRGQRLAHVLESNLLLALIAIVVIGGLAYVGAIHGVPWAAEKLATKVPDSVRESVSEQTLDYLDGWAFKPTGLSVNRRRELRAYLNAHTPVPVRIDFRNASMANAFALPSGQIVFTDELIDLAENDEEILSIFLHEVGHVAHDHGIRSVLQASAWSVMLTLVLSDATALVDALSTLPLILAQTAFSRDFEREADDYAYNQMLEQRVPLHRFADIMTRLEGCEEYDDDGECTLRPWDDGDARATDEDTIFDYLSTHPSTAERVERFNTGR